ncbi:MAG: hypothetical protein GF334_04135 [Candidatus Altiarchaeales archaeon]|nr:hypothetical protein [Candidatus Altiarchaeales archaeon]
MRWLKPKMSHKILNKIMFRFEWMAYSLICGFNLLLYGLILLITPVRKMIISHSWGFLAYTLFFTSIYMYLLSDYIRKKHPNKLNISTQQLPLKVYDINLLLE